MRENGQKFYVFGRVLGGYSLVGWLVWLPDRHVSVMAMAGWLAGWLDGWLAGWLTLL